MSRTARLGVTLLWMVALVATTVAPAAAQPSAPPPPVGSVARPTPGPTDPAVVVPRYRVPIDGSPTAGPATAKVTVVVFSDFQCPFCGKHAETIHALQTRYGPSLRVVFKNVPLGFHHRAEPAAQLALEAFARLGHRGFWQAHDRLFSQQQKLEDGDLEQIAADLGLDPKRTMRAVTGRAHQARIERDLDLADDVESRGTPTTYLNGRKLSGARNIEEFAQIVDEEIAVADGLRRKGIAASRIYDELQKDALVPGAPKKVKPPRVTAAQPSRGPAGAPVTIQIFSDFECPFCARTRDAIDRVEQDFGTKVRIVWRHFPLAMHAHAREAATAAMEAFAQRGSAGFWAMHDRLFEQQRSLDRETLRAIAKEVGVDVARMDRSIDADRYAAAIDGDSAIASALDIQGTPTLLVNGYVIEGAPTPTKLARTVRRALGDLGTR